MGKKLITAALALVALAAFALPAGASASPRLCETNEKGECTNITGGTKITATQLGVSKLTSTSKTGAGEVLTECSSASMTGELTKNNGTEIEGNIETTSFSGTAAEGKCTGLGGIKVTTTVGNGTPWCIRAINTMATDEFQVRGGKCSEPPRGITFTLDTGLGVSCGYERTEPLRGTFTTDTTEGEDKGKDAILTLKGEGETGITDTGFKREGTNVLCPESGTLDMQFTLETDKTTAEPLYIK